MSTEMQGLFSAEAAAATERAHEEAADGGSLSDGKGSGGGSGSGGRDSFGGKYYTSEELAGLSDADRVNLAAGTDIRQNTQALQTVDQGGEVLYDSPDDVPMDTHSESSARSSLGDDGDILYDSPDDVPIGSQLSRQETAATPPTDVSPPAAPEQTPPVAETAPPPTDVLPAAAQEKAAGDQKALDEKAAAEQKAQEDVAAQQADERKSLEPILNHVLNPDFSSGDIRGLHHIEGPQNLNKGRVVDMLSPPNEHGLYEAVVEAKNPINGEIMQKYSTMFPDSYTKEDVADCIANARKFGTPDSNGKITGPSGRGFDIRVIPGKTAYPVI